MKKLRIILLFGGKSGEHEVSINSARNVMAAIDTEKYEVVPLCISKKGTWLQGEKAVNALASGKSVSDTVHNKNIIPLEMSTQTLDMIVFPVLHGPYGEDGTIQGMLEMMNMPYVGSGVLGSALGMDKILQKQVFMHHGLPVVPFFWFFKKEWETKRKDVLLKIKAWNSDYPFFIKPANLGSSVGISKAHNEEELCTSIDDASLYDRKIIIEKGLENIREIEVSILGNNNPIASVCGEILPSHEFYDYNAKYADDTTQTVVPADIPKAIEKRIQNIAVKAFQALDCAGFARVDFFLEKKTNNIWLNEINTIPGFTSISMYPKLWEASGISYEALIDKLITLGIERWKEKQELKTSFV